MNAGLGPACVYLVRHGATPWTEAGRHQGWADVPLSAGGEAEADRLAVRLRAVAFDAAYTSPLQRARHTAERVLAGRGLRAAPADAFRELSYGAWQGLTRAEWEARDDATAARWETSPWSVTFPEGESLDDVARRAVPAWERIVEAHRGETVLVAAHGHLIRVLLLHALALPRSALWELRCPTAGGWCVEHDGGRGTARPIDADEEGGAGA